MSSIDLTNHFPYDKPRDQQIAAIEEGLKCLSNDDKRFFVLEAGTGVGKSAIGLTLASLLGSKITPDEEFLRGSYTLTTQKILQRQYVNDFNQRPHHMLDLKSSSNYPCGFHSNMSCGESLRSLRAADNA